MRQGLGDLIVNFSIGYKLFEKFAKENAYRMEGHRHPMSKTNNSKTKWLWLSVFILFICVAATAIAFFKRFSNFLLDDKGAIPLSIDNTQQTENDSNEKKNNRPTGGTTNSKKPSTGQESANNDDPTGISDDSSSEIPQTNPSPTNPGFEVSDDKTVWNTETQVDIFHTSYTNGEKTITVNSDNGERVIAPGTETSYTFKFKNTGNVALDYTIKLEAYFTPDDIEIPITGKVSRYDGEWILGNENIYENVAALNSAEDKATLGAGKYTYYTLSWLWPFESEDDKTDTILGNCAPDQDLLFTIAIKITVTESSEPNSSSGITSPQTGDDTNIILWGILALISFAVMIFLLFYQKKENRHYNSEKDKF